MQQPLDSHRSSPPTLGYLGSSTVMEQPWQAGLIDAARQQGVNLIIFAGGALDDPHRYDTQRARIFELAGPENVDGLIIGSDFLGHYVGAERIHKFCAGYQPLPIVKYEPLVAGYPTLLFDFYGGMYDLVTHLIEVHGLHKIGYISGPEQSPTIADRLRAYRDALAAHGIPYDPGLVVAGSQAMPTGSDAVRVLLDERKLRPKHDLEAIVGFYDLVAAGAQAALQARGIAVPEDIAVAGFDDDDVAFATGPRLTTVRLPFYEFGRWGVETLAAMLRGQSAPPVTVLPAALVTRRSCGCHAPRVAFRLPAPPPTGGDPCAESGTVVTGSAGGSGASAVPLSRAALLEAMVAASGLRNLPRFCQELATLLDLFLEHRAGGQAGALPAFVKGMERAVDAMPGIFYNIDMPYAVLATLADALLAAAQEDAEHRHIQRLVQAAQAVIGDRIERFLLRDKQETTRIDGLLHDLNQALATALDVGDLVEVLASHLPALGIPACYLSLYENPEQVCGAAHLVLAFNRSGRISLPPGGQRFTARELAPRKLWEPQPPAALVVLPLFHRRESLGFVALEVGPRYGGLYEGVREQISSALIRIELHRGLVEARRQAEEANALKSRFLSTVTHELRTPLAMIVNLSTSLRTTAGSGAGITHLQEDLELIRAIGEHLDHLVLDVLDLGRSQLGQLRIVRRPLDLRDVLQAVAAAGEQMAHAKGLVWRTHIPPYLPPVEADRARLQQVLLNLIVNATKFTLHGEVVLHAAVHDREVLLAISDTGLGIPQADQGIIFDEFRQSERTSARGYGGMGLGLAIARRLVELHGGTMGLISSGEEGRGATFYLTLPAGAETPAGTGEPRPHPARVTEETVAGLVQAVQPHAATGPRANTILLVDDDVDVLRVQTQSIQRRLPHADIYSAGSGRQALELMRRLVPDLVLLDLKMPELDGMGVLQEMQMHAQLRTVPVIVMTAQVPDGEALKTLSPNVTAVVGKGLFDENETLAKIEQALRHDRQGAEAKRVARLCMAYIHAHYAAPVSRRELAQQAGINERYLTQCFHKVVGVPPIEYLNRYRVHVAKRLLLGGDRSIKQIADETGFGGGPQFSRVFRQYTGMSPREFVRSRPAR